MWWSRWEGEGKGLVGRYFFVVRVKVRIGVKVRHKIDERIEHGVERRIEENGT